MNAQLQPTGSAYFLTKETAAAERHTLSVLVDTEPGIRARIAGLFSARGFNIESLTVSEVQHDEALSRITVVTIATPKVLSQIKLQLERLVPVHRVHDLTAEGKALERELALIKVGGTGEHRAETLRLADAFRAQIVDATVESFVFEVTGKPSKIDSFIGLMVPLGLIEVVRTGLAAISRGPEGM
jgi:acetolactate synthase-1/3 small subunit